MKCIHSNCHFLFSPATVILIIIGGLKYAWNFNYIFSLLLLLFLTFFFCLICLFTSQDVQLKTAKVLTLIFSLLMGAVAVGVVEQIATGNARDGNPTPTTPTQSKCKNADPGLKDAHSVTYYQARQEEEGGQLGQFALGLNLKGGPRPQAQERPRTPAEVRIPQRTDEFVFFIFQMKI